MAVTPSIVDDFLTMAEHHLPQESMTTKPTATHFPCIELPARVIFSSRRYNIQLSTADGLVCTTSSRTQAEEFFLLPFDEHDGKERFLIQSVKKRHYLTCGPDGSVATTPLDASDSKEEKRDLTKWYMNQQKGGSITLTTDFHNDLSLFEENESHPLEMHLACLEDGSICTTEESTEDPTNHNSIYWTAEFQTGELLYISSPKADKRIRCGLKGELSPSNNWQGWEVWRFLETGQEGHVRITSFCHHKKFLSSDSDGNVFTTEDREAPETKWSIAKYSSDGVTIQSVATCRNLRVFGDQLYTTLERNDAFGAWQLEAAHLQTYFLSTISGKRIGSNARAPYLTMNPIKNRSEQWTLEGQGNGIVTLYCVGRQIYLGSTKCGRLFVAPTVSHESMWRFTESSEGHTFTSEAHNRVLSYNLCTTEPVNENDDDDATSKWQLKPVLPRQVNASKLQTLAVATTAAVATTVALPFVLGGAAAMLGIAEVGLAAEVITGGIVAAEAMVDIVVVGTTARTLLHNVNVGLEDDRENENGMRPFSSWRDW
jgi:hypothetical protein